MIPETKGIWWTCGQRWLDEQQLADVYTNRIESLRDLIELYDREILQSDTRGFARDRKYFSMPATYPTSCSPQARAAGSVFCSFRRCWGSTWTLPPNGCIYAPP